MRSGLPRPVRFVSDSLATMCAGKREVRHDDPIPRAPDERASCVHRAGVQRVST